MRRPWAVDAVKVAQQGKTSVRRPGPECCLSLGRFHVRVQGFVDTKPKWLSYVRLKMQTRRQHFTLVSSWFRPDCQCNVGLASVSGRTNTVAVCRRGGRTVGGAIRRKVQL